MECTSKETKIMKENKKGKKNGQINKSNHKEMQRLKKNK